MGIVVVVVVVVVGGGGISCILSEGFYINSNGEAFRSGAHVNILWSLDPSGFIFNQKVFFVFNYLFIGKAIMEFGCNFDAVGDFLFEQGWVANVDTSNRSDLDFVMS